MAVKKIDCVLIGEDKVFIDTKTGKPINYVDYTLNVNGEIIGIKIDKNCKPLLRYLVKSSVGESDA